MFTINSTIKSNGGRSTASHSHRSLSTGSTEQGRHEGNPRSALLLLVWFNFAWRKVDKAGPGIICKDHFHQPGVRHLDLITDCSLHMFWPVINEDPTIKCSATRTHFPNPQVNSVRRWHNQNKCSCHLCKGRCPSFCALHFISI